MKVKELVELLQVKGSFPSHFLRKEISGFRIDSRKVKEGDFFVPLKGSRFDGHSFIPDALERGAIGFFSEKPTGLEGELPVRDSLQALTEVGKHKRKSLSTVVAITGTSGKTTTKELTAFALKEFFPVYSTAGNYNNEIGVPYTLANIPEG
ncbi:MAG: UDP-N-acetylmuramoylalanyl-D-glutamate--2,6-diaminopimelate ligase, partial [Aquificae bacterium]|nr:UDP-N-acetylmuramoylalanyl-D-glutamate--2,6-diaminopimelate ligase [Aquificota bacterium]